MTIVDFGYPLVLLFPDKLFGFPIFRYLAYIMEFIPVRAVRTKFDIYVFIISIKNHILQKKYK